MTTRYSALRQDTQRSAQLHERAKRVLPGGIAHDARAYEPYPTYISRAQGSRKWDVDGYEYIDYSLGHGALILGHGRPEVVAAVHDQLVRGTHFGACHELEVEWAELVHATVPCAERVRFVSSGTEATLLALRVARAFTGRSQVVRFHEHFHGWEDYLSRGLREPYDVPVSAGIPREIFGTVIPLPGGAVGQVEKVLEGRDVACVIVEPTGGYWGSIPLDPAFLADLREITTRTGTLLLFDEVVSGFRMAPGGAQEYYRVRPDLCTLAKCLSGGLPGGAVAGHADVMERLELRRDDSQWNRFHKVAHTGTFNANPLSAAAGVAALCLLRTGEHQSRASALAKDLRTQLNLVLRDRGVAGFVHGVASFFHIHLGGGVNGAPDGTLGEWDQRALLQGLRHGPVVAAIRRGMLKRGVDLIRSSGMLSSAHTDQDVHDTVRAFDSSLEELVDNGIADRA